MLKFEYVHKLTAALSPLKNRGEGLVVNPATNQQRESREVDLAVSPPAGEQAVKTKNKRPRLISAPGISRGKNYTPRRVVGW